MTDGAIARHVSAYVPIIRPPDMRNYPQRTSQLALWSRRLAIFGIAVAIAGIGLARFGILPALQGLVVIGAGSVCAMLALVLAGAAYVDIWRSGAIGLTRANVGFLLALAALAFPAWQIARAYRLPPINDISTDLRDPPAFSRARTALDARQGHVPGESGQDVREAQRLAYPDVAPVVLEMGPEEAYQLVLEAVAEMKWQIVDRSPPSVRVGAGRIDAIDRTMVMKFSDDITIRIRPLANETRVDIRSVSRVGRHDLGTNAARIRKFTDVLAGLNRG